MSTETEEERKRKRLGLTWLGPHQAVPTDIFEEALQPEKREHEFIPIEKPGGEVAVAEEKLRRKGLWLKEWLNRKLAELGPQKYNDQLDELKKRAELAYQDMEREKLERLRQEESERLEKARKRAEDYALSIMWESPNQEFLERQLFVSQAERSRTLDYYLTDCAPRGSALYNAFIREFIKMLLDRLDNLEKRRLQP